MPGSHSRCQAFLLFRHGQQSRPAAKGEAKQAYLCYREALWSGEKLVSGKVQ